MLLVAVELCTLSFRLDELTKANIVATALFGDGADACVLRVGEAGIASAEMSGQHIWPDTLDIMGWSVDPRGFGVIFDRAILPFAEANMAPAIAGILERAGLNLTTLTGLRSIRAAPRSSTPWSEPFRWSKALLITSEPYWPNMAICQRQPLFSCWSASFNSVCHHAHY